MSTEELAAPLLQLSEPLPDLVVDPPGLARAADAVGAGTGPVAIDAERASGYRYSQRAYLVQLRRVGAGTVLIDPVAVGDLAPLARVLVDVEWILHAATQDLPCLAEVGLAPARLFDTELAARLLNLPRVGLAALVEDLLGSRLAKEHSAVDWSTRPLPPAWLEYAALDVEVLAELRDLLADQLVEAGKQEWAEQEFEALLAFTGPALRIDPWRRTSGLHRVRGRRALAAARELWLARDRIAADLDVTPGRVLPDAALVEAARTMPDGRRAVLAIPSMRRLSRRHVQSWQEALASAAGLSEDELPTLAARYDGPPPSRSWPGRHPEAAARLVACRAAVGSVAEKHCVPTENLLAPDAVRRLAWAPPEPATEQTVTDRLVDHGARHWQVQLCAAALVDALTAPLPEPLNDPETGA